jgi:carbamoyl-phosphate synthase large subunit
MTDPTRLTVAVTGLNATDNPAPGVGVIRALRHDPEFRGRIVGLSYDALDSGNYARDLVDDVFLFPYPSQGLGVVEARLRYIHEQVPIDVIVPTLDSELPGFFELEPVLRELGIGSFLPTSEQFELRSKVHLATLGERSDISVPAAEVLSGVEQLATLHERMPYPVWVKGPLYGAQKAYDMHEATVAFHQMVAKWGLPVVVQADVQGDEYDVAAVGDGRGGMVGAVAMRKTLLTDKGKGWAGVTVRDPALFDLTSRFFAATRWRGPCEVEALKDRDGHWHLLEVNPRFPAWIHTSAGAGLNLPRAVVRLAAGIPVEPSTDYRAGTLFVRIAIDQIATLSDYEALVTSGELRSARENP